MPSRRQAHSLRKLRSSLVGLVVLLGVTACSNASRSPAASAPLTVPTSVTISISENSSGARLPAGFLGFGLEANTLAFGEFAHTNLADYMRLLDAHGLLRIGGNSVESFWTATGERAPAWSHGRVTPASLRQMAAAIKDTGWRVILGVPFKRSTPARAADEARYAERILGRSLAGVEIGNEPDLYRISESAYFPKFERFDRAIRLATPQIPIAGPATSRVGTSWIPIFVRDEKPHPDIGLFTSHEYPLSRCEGQQPTIDQLLSVSSEEHEATAADDAVSAGRTLGVPALIDETNSIVCWGQPGVSNTYASALWILDYGLLLADHGVTAANFQTRIAGCKPYLPLCTGAHGSSLHARPEFYGLLGIRQMGSGRFLTVTNPASTGLRVFAVANAPGRLSIAVDDLGGATTVHLRLPAAGYTAAHQTVLRTSSARGLRATADISLGGRRVGANAQMAAPIYRAVSVHGRSVTLHLEPHTARILKLR